MPDSDEEWIWGKSYRQWKLALWAVGSTAIGFWLAPVTMLPTPLLWMAGGYTLGILARGAACARLPLPSVAATVATHTTATVANSLESYLYIGPLVSLGAIGAMAWCVVVCGSQELELLTRNLSCVVCSMFDQWGWSIIAGPLAAPAVFVGLRCGSC